MSQRAETTFEKLAGLTERHSNFGFGANPSATNYSKISGSINGDKARKSVTVAKKPKAWDFQHKQVRIDINYYRAKYDFDVAQKICPLQAGALVHEEF